MGSRRPERANRRDELPSLRPLAKWVRHGSVRIQDPDVETRLDRYLSERFTYRSRTQWVRLIESGRIRVDGRRCRPSQRVRFGSRIDYVPERRPEPSVNAAIQILAEDEAVLAVDKPADLPVHPSGRYYRNTLLTLLLERRGETLDTATIKIVHRLDRETSGVVLFGKGTEAARRLARQFESRTARKEYLLLVQGIPREESFTVDRPLGANRASRVRKSVGVVSEGEGRSALTEFQVLSRGPEHALLIARPRTGRLHQIRVHAAAAGHPLVGDKLYGGNEEMFLKLVEGRGYSELDRERLVLGRQALHAWRITVTHPAKGAPATYTAPLPEDLREACARLGIQPVLPDAEG